MRRFITPQEAGRKFAYDSWIENTMPMVTVVSTLDVTRVVRYSKRKKMKLNMLMCYCILKAAYPIREFFYFLDGKQMVYAERLTIQTILNTKQGGLGFCDIPYCETLEEFSKYYDNNSRLVIKSSQHLLDTDGAPIYTSCVPNLYLDAAVNQYCNKFSQPFIVWGRYRKAFLWRYKLPISFQFHHVQMDGQTVGTFFNNLQEEFNKLK